MFQCNELTAIGLINLVKMLIVFYQIINNYTFGDYSIIKTKIITIVENVNQLTFFCNFTNKTVKLFFEKIIENLDLKNNISTIN